MNNLQHICLPTSTLTLDIPHKTYLGHLPELSNNVSWFFDALEDAEGGKEMSVRPPPPLTKGDKTYQTHLANSSRIGIEDENYWEKKYNPAYKVDSINFPAGEHPTQLLDPNGGYQSTVAPLQ